MTTVKDFIGFIGEQNEAVEHCEIDATTANSTIINYLTEIVTLQAETIDGLLKRVELLEGETE